MSIDHWFADISDDDDAVEGAPWQPFLQIAGGCFPLPIWFATEADCQSFIATIPQGSAVTFGRARPRNDHPETPDESWTRKRPSQWTADERAWVRHIVFGAPWPPENAEEPK